MVLRATFWVACVSALTLYIGAGLMGQTTAVKSPIEAELVIVKNGEFYPQSIKRKPGIFLLVIYNWSPADTTSIGIVNDKQAIVQNAEPSAARCQDFKLDLAAGTYVMADSVHPKQAPLTISITP